MSKGVEILEKLMMNAMQPPKVYYGLHFTPGVAEYTDQESGENYRIFISEKTAKSMDKSMNGIPLYVNHVAEVDLSKIQAEAAGYVIESFYNQLDGNHWCKFIVVSDDGHQAIKNGYTLSNTYKPLALGAGGTRHNVEYLREITDAEYRHMALVDDPRYEHSMVLTAEEFKAYNLNKEQELQAVANSKDTEESSMKLKFWEKTEMKNAKDLNIEGMSVTLPKSNKEITILELVNSADEAEQSKGKAKAAVGIDTVVLNEKETLTVEELKTKYLELRNAKDKEDGEMDNESDEDEEMDNDAEEEEKAKKKEAEEKANAAAEKEAQDKKDKEEKANAKKAQFDKINNANRAKPEARSAEDGADKVARGKTMFGSAGK